VQRFDNFHIAIFIKIQKEPLMQAKTTCISGFSVYLGSVKITR
jgi:hypothetical protein